MQAVILAGGLGMRLSPLTEQVPKVMALVNGQPFLGHLLELLKNQGIKDIILCVGYLGEQVRLFFDDGQGLGLDIKYSEERERLLGTGGALKQARNLLDERFLVINGDTYLPIDYAEVEGSFVRHGKEALMVVYDNREDTGVGNNVELNKDGLVSGYDKERSAPGLTYVEAGALVLSRKTLDIIETGHPVSLEKQLYPALIRREEMAACVTGQRFYDIGTPERLKSFEEFLRKKMK